MGSSKKDALEQWRILYGDDHAPDEQRATSSDKDTGSVGEGAEPISEQAKVGTGGAAG